MESQNDTVSLRPCVVYIKIYFRCAGVCSYEGRGGLCSVRLSRPLLKYRPRRDLVQTLLVRISSKNIYLCVNA